MNTNIDGNRFVNATTTNAIFTNGIRRNIVSVSVFLFTQLSQWYKFNIIKNNFGWVEIEKEKNNM